MSMMLLAGGLMFSVALIACLILVVAHTRLTVPVDPREGALAALLPQANCGGCGFPSCAEYARVLAGGGVPPDRCSVGGSQVAALLASSLGIALVPNAPYRPVIHCSAKRSDRLGQGNYTGIPTCAAANVVGGVQGLHLRLPGIRRLRDGLRFRSDPSRRRVAGGRLRAVYRLRGVRQGVSTHIIEQVPFKSDRVMVVGCSNHDPGKAVREVCKVGCIGCSACSRMMPELIHMHENLVHIDYERLTGQEDFAPVQAKCPMKSLVIMGKPLPRHEQELARVPAVDVAHPAPRPAATQTETANWRG